METQQGTSVWIQLYVGGEKSGDVFIVKPVPEDVHDLREAVKEKWPELSYCASNDLTLFPPGTSVEKIISTRPVP
jgi:hypothetical protein